MTRFISILKSILKFNELDNLIEADIILLGNDYDRSFIFEGKMYSQILDSIDYYLKENELESIHLALPLSNKLGEITYSNVKGINGILNRAKIVNKIKHMFINNSSNTLIKAWQKILKKINARYIISIQPPPELCIAAKIQNIIVFDFQHGVLSSEGYYGNNYRNNFGNRGWPEFILCWNQSSADWVKDNCPIELSVIVLGNPWFIRFTDRSLDDHLVTTYSLSNFFSESKRPKILISLQWGDNSSTSILGIPTNLFDFIKNKGADFDWCLRIHPVLLHDSYLLSKFESTFKGINNVEWLSSSFSPLPLVLKNVKLHMTSHSALTVEASWFGIKTALLHEDIKLLNEYFHDEINSGIADIVPATFTNIEQWIIDNLNNSFVIRSCFIDSPKSINKFIKALKLNSFK